MELLVPVGIFSIAGINYFLLLVYKIFCMSSIDWIVLVLTLAGIVAYGLYKSRTSKNLEGYFLSNRSMPWHLVLLSIMGTQASAITFLSAPGQAFTDGMRFVQYYFGLPLAMIVISISFVPLFKKLKVFTAYEFLLRSGQGIVNEGIHLFLLFLLHIPVRIEPLDLSGNL